MRNICHNTPQRRFRKNISGILARCYLLLSVFIGAMFTHAQAQTFFIKENFSNTVGNTPPQGWENIRLSGGSGVGFRFDNSTNLQVPYPLQAPFAVFDPTATPWQGTSQTVTLQSPEIDLSGVSSLLLSVDHKYSIGADATGRIQTWADNVWTDVAVFSASTSGVETSTYDVSSLLAGKKAGRLRFMWTGKQEGHWMIDNVKLYAPAGVDAGISSIDVPKDPFGEGTSDISVTLLNYGSTTLNNAKIKWSLNGVVQPDASWSGSLAFAQKKPAIRIGQMNLRAGVSYLFKIWSEDPNGQYDDNPTNDTIVRTLIPSLCGTYTIGGSNPNFQTITRAVEFLHSAGIGCPVVMKIRDGVYDEQFELKAVRGSSFVNTITFESESNDTSKVLITSGQNVTSYRYTVNVNGSSHVKFRKLSFLKKGYMDYYAIQISQNSANIHLDSCKLGNTDFNSSVYISENANNIYVTNNYFEGRGNHAIILNTSGKIFIRSNIFSKYYIHTIAGTASDIYIENNKFLFSDIHIRLNINSFGKISNNVITKSQTGIYLSGMGKSVIDNNLIEFIDKNGIESDINRITLFNNIITNKLDTSLKSTAAIRIKNSLNTYLGFNTLRLVRNSKNVAGLMVDMTDSLTIHNNILQTQDGGLPIILDKVPKSIIADRNNFFSNGGIIGRAEDRNIINISEWQSITNDLDKSFIGNSGFTNDSSYVPTLILLNERGIPSENINYDYYGRKRNEIKPDIGAVEFDVCDIDASISNISFPISPITPGSNPIKISLLNNGKKSISAALISWQVDDNVINDFFWNGNLQSGEETEIEIGSFDFKALKGHIIRAWVRISQDCNIKNDSAYSKRLFSRLCGEYTIGGVNPDFQNIESAMLSLMDAGVDCPVTFKIRNGIYREQVQLFSIPGASNINTVTFESESKDSSKVTITAINSEKGGFYAIRLFDASHVRFRYLRFEIEGSDLYSGLVIGGTFQNVEISNNLFDTKGGNSRGLIAENKGNNLIIKNNRFGGTSNIGIALNINGSAIIDNNIFIGNKEYGIIGQIDYLSISGNVFHNIAHTITLNIIKEGSILGNLINNAYRGIYCEGNGTITIEKNIINVNEYVALFSKSYRSIIQNNWIYNTANKKQNTEYGIIIQDSKNTKLLHNSIYLSLGSKQSIALKIDRGDSITISNNIIAIKQFGIPVFIETKPVNLYMNHNNYFSPFKIVGWHNKKIFDNLDNWRKDLNIELHGHFSNPYFYNDSTLIASQIFLNNNADNQWKVEKDYYGKSRNIGTPDIGAVEFSPCDVDFGLLAFESPVSPLDVGLQKVKIRLQNNGLNPVTSATIRWTVNGQEQKEYVWQGNLTSAQTTELEIGSFDFRPMTEYGIKVWMVNDPQSSSGKDCNSLNDTLQSIKLYTRLCGIYTIGGVNPDFKTITEASQFLVYAGISCPVTFKIRDGVYKEQIQIDSVMGASRTNTITFESATGDRDKVIIYSEQPAENPIKYTLNLNGTRYTKLRNLTLASSGYYYHRAIIRIKSSSFNNEISNCYFNDMSSGSVQISIEQDADSTLITRSLFSGFSSIAINMNIEGHITANDNIFLSNEWHSISGAAKSVEFQRNQMDGNQLSVSLNIKDTATIVSNIFRQPNNGIYVRGSARYLIQFNRIGFRSGTGLETAEIRKGLIANNWIYNVAGLSTNGMALTRSDSVKVLFNSINITGTNNNSSAIAIQGGKDNQVFNNIIKNASGGYCMKIIGGTERLLSDYNCYYAPLNNVGSIDERIYNSLSLWGNIINGESNSIFINPFFKSNSEYRPNHILLNDAGITINPVKFDIDSTLRHPVSPDMGVKEFTPCNNDAGINEFTSPVLPMGAGKQDIRVILQNQGLGTINSVRIHWSVNGAVQPSFDWTGTLPTRKNVEVQIGQMEFLAGPEWNIRAWTSQPNGIADCNNYNDTTLLFVPGTPNSVPYPPSARDTSVCIGNSAKIYAKGVGRLGWYTAPTGGTWLGSDSILVTPPLFATTTYYVQDSVLKASLARTPVKVTVFTPPPFDAVPDRIYSRADTYTLGIDSSLKGTDLRWSTGDSTTTIQVRHSSGFRVRFTTPDGCRLTDSVFVQFPDTAILRAATVNGSCVVPVEVPVSVGNFRRITQFMGELSWDTARLSFDSIRTYSSLGMQEKDFNKGMTMAGRLSFSWAAPSASWKSLPDSTIIFAVRLVPTTALLTDLQVNLSIDTARFSFYNDQPKKLKTTAINGSVKVTTCLMQLEGKVITPLDEGVVNVQMSLAGPESRQTMTKQDGTYSLSASKGNYTLTPFKNNEREKLNGISTLDLALIQSHVLLRQRLGNAYKVIAADANQSGSVTTVDIMHLRRMLLRMDTSLPGNRTWAFVDADRTFSNPNSPFPFPQNKTLAEGFGKVTHTFRAIKLGDVNYDRNPKLDLANVADTLKLFADFGQPEGTRMKVSIKAEAIRQLMGFQGTLAWDTSRIILEKITANPLQIAVSDQTIGQGMLMFSWNDPQATGMDLSQGTTLFEGVFRRIDPIQKAVIRLADEHLMREAFDAQFQRLQMTLTKAILEEDTQPETYFRAFPNPAKDHVTIHWKTADQGPAVIRIIDMHGRILMEQRTEMQAGVNQHRIDLNRKFSQGSYLIQIEQAGVVKTHQMLISN